jgi:hypothetical protein
MRARAWMRIISAVVVCAACGCASARYVTKGTDEGVVSMPADTPRNREKAYELMADHFPEGYEIVFEEEAKVGSVTHVHARTDEHHHHGGSPSPLLLAEHMEGYGQTPGDSRGAESHSWSAIPGSGFFGGTTHSDLTATTTDKTEWRIRYRRQRPVPNPTQNTTDISPSVSLDSYPVP